jgi:phage terminase small subunit
LLVTSASCPDFSFEPHYLCLLQAACEAWDRAQAAREQVANTGLTFIDPSGSNRANPAVAIEPGARTLFARILRELNFDEEPNSAD